MSSPVQGVIVAHSSLASGLAAAVRQVCGADGDALRALSNEGYGPEALVEALSQATGGAPTIIFTDLPSGSCAFAARKLALTGIEEVGVVFGVNLPMLMDFVFHRDLPLGELVDRLVSKGRQSIAGTPAGGKV